MIVPAKRICDFCGCDNPKHCDIKLPVVTRCEWAEGRPTERHIEIERYDICEKCLLKATNIRCGFQGSNPLIVKAEEG